jgi:hypothetical protein
MTEMLPLLYLYGLCSADFGPAPEQFIGSRAGLSARSINGYRGYRESTESWADNSVDRLPCRKHAASRNVGVLLDVEVVVLIDMSENWIVA